MTASKDDVLAALGKISGPGGVPLPATGKLSEIVATDGKVFFSITVDAGEVRMETVRERAGWSRGAFAGRHSGNRSDQAASVNRPSPSISRSALRELGLKVGILDADI